MDVIINDAPLHDDNIIYNSNGKMWCALGRSKNWHEVGLNMKIALQHEAWLENSYLAIDDVEVGVGNKIPLWIFGFLHWLFVKYK